MKILHAVKLALAELDNLAQGWKTYIFLVTAIVGYYVLPEGVAKEFTAAIGLIGVGVARFAKKVNEE